MQQDHEAVKEVEAVRGGVVDGCADGDARLCQALHHCHDLHKHIYANDYNCLQ